MRKGESEQVVDVFRNQQGTIYADVLESDGVKAHLNVGGLPEDLQFELCEPVKLLFKDEVRVIGRELGHLTPKPCGTIEFE